MEGGPVDRSLEKWLSVWASELVYTWNCEHTLNMTRWQDILSQQGNIFLVRLTAGLSNDESDKCDTSNRPLDDHDDTSVTVLTTSCVSVIDVYIVKKTQTQTFDITRMRSQAWHNNEHVKDDSWPNKKKGSKTCTGNTWNDFLCLCTCILLRAWW